MTQYHLHLETRRARPDHLKLTEEKWHAAAARHRQLAERLRVTIGYDGEMLDEALQTADFMINQHPPRERLRERAPNLKWIQTTGAGIDAIIPLDWLPHGITLTNNTGAHGPKAEDSCTLALLMLHARVPEMMRNQQRHDWQMVLTTPIAGRTAVIVGFGDLGHGAARAARKLGLKVIALSRSGKGDAAADEAHPVAKIDEVLPRADFVVVTVPLTAETRGLIDRRRVGLLRRGAGFVNIGRAAVVDYDALRERIERGELLGAVLDVFEPEPLPAESPLWDTPNVVIWPHVSCDEPGYIDHLLDFWFENLERFLARKPLVNALDAKRGY